MCRSGGASTVVDREPPPRVSLVRRTMDRHRASCEGGAVSSSSASVKDNNKNNSSTSSDTSTGIQCSNEDFPGSSRPPQGAPHAAAAAAAMPPAQLVDESPVSSHSMSRSVQLFECNDTGDPSTHTHHHDSSVSLGGGRDEAAHVFFLGGDGCLSSTDVPMRRPLGGLEASAGGAMSALPTDGTRTPWFGTPVSWPYGMENNNVAWAGGRARGDWNRDLLDLSAADEDTSATAAVGEILAEGAEIFGTGAAARGVAGFGHPAVHPVLSQEGVRPGENRDHGDTRISKEVRYGW